MAITLPQAVSFCNERARVFADSMVVTYETARAFTTLWTAGGMAVLIPNSSGEAVMDGSVSDGRFPIHGQHVNGLLTAASAIVTWFETVVGGSTRIALIRQIAVNGVSRF